MPEAEYSSERAYASAQKWGGDHTAISAQTKTMRPERPPPAAVQPIRAGKMPVRPPGSELNTVCGLMSSV